MTDVGAQLRRLKVLNEKCGGVSKKGKDQSEEEVDLSKMSPYQQAQYKVACEMRNTRENIAELEGLGAKASITRKTELSNTIRKQLTNMKRETDALQKIAVKEQKKDEYDQLVGHVKKTANLFKARSGRVVDDNVVPAPGTSLSKIDLEMNDIGAPALSLRDDEEFVQFFEQTKKRDVEIDQALDRLGQGVTRLHENATMIKTELQIQKVLLDETEQKVDKVHANLQGVNKKLKETIKQIDNDRMCLYVFCCILLLGVAGGIYWVIEGNKH